MKTNRITKRLTLTNVLIVVLSMLIFFTIVLMVYNNNTYNEIKQQLIMENKVANTLYTNDIVKQPAFYKVLTDSINLIYSRDDGSLNLVYSSVEDFEDDIDIEELAKSLIRTRKKVIEVRVGTEDYFCTMSTDRRENGEVNSVIVSMISIKNVRLVTRRFTFALMVSIAALSLISVIITILVSRRITKPIVKLTAITKQYEQRNFDADYIAKTNDELEDLSIAVNSMAKSLKEHDSEKERLFRQISHEIKTPLTSIYGYAEGIKNGVFKEIDKPLDIIMSESLRIKKLTENIVLLSKLESNIEAFRFQSCNLASILERAIESVESVAILSDIDIDYTPASNLPFISADEDKLYRAFVNILSNCTKYASSIIRIQTVEQKDSIEILISDDGNGFESDDLKNLLSGIAREKSNGSGIGLSIVNEIVRAHGSQFFIGNNPSGGAYFKILLKKGFTPPLS